MNSLLGLDPTNAENLTHILWSAQFGDSFPQKIYRSLWHRDLETTTRFSPIWMNRAEQRDDATEAVVAMLASIALGKGSDGPDAYSFSRAWLPVFHDLFRAGHINAVAYGRAVRLIYFCSDAPAGSREHNALCLDAFRCADPAGMMYEHERQFLAALPDVVSLYRGSFVAMPEHGSQGLSWTNNPHVAEGYSHMRSAAPQGGSHRTMLIEAQVPREAILAVLLSPTSTYEALVDYEALPETAAVEGTLIGKLEALSAFANA